jgi:hypothetical protein
MQRNETATTAGRHGHVERAARQARASIGTTPCRCGKTTTRYAVKLGALCDDCFASARTDERWKQILETRERMRKGTR